jgi:predicted SAM-dependent methyltransferase
MKTIAKLLFDDFWWGKLRDLKREIFWEYRVLLGIRKSRKFIKNIEVPFKLQLGCGLIKKPGWVNTDIVSTPEARPDAILDLRRNLPFPDESCLEIYSNHVFEHLPYPSVANHVLKESLRILRPGGIFRVVVPDLDAFLKKYFEVNDSGYMKWVFQTNNPSVFLKTRAETINVFFRQWGEHHFAYDFETLSKLLMEAGFHSVNKREYDPNIDHTQRSESLYLDAIK